MIFIFSEVEKSSPSREDSMVDGIIFCVICILSYARNLYFWDELRQQKFGGNVSYIVSCYPERKELSVERKHPMTMSNSLHQRLS